MRQGVALPAFVCPSKAEFHRGGRRVAVSAYMARVWESAASWHVKNRFRPPPESFFWERRLAHRRGSVRIEFTRSVMRQSSSCDAADQRQVHYPPRRGLPAADERAGRRLGRIRAGASVRRWRRRFDPPLIKPERSVPCLQVGYPATVREGGAAERRLRWKSGAARNVAEHIKK